MQAVIDEEIDEEKFQSDAQGLVIFLDFEKAFDRVAWPFLNDAMQALGYGSAICRWIGMMYDVNNAPTRRVSVNGHLSEEFQIKCGVAQGCPLSPILFLFVAEGLARAIADSDEIVGTTIGGQEFRISQFADDTVLFLRDYLGWKHARRVLNRFCRASAMRLNTDKTEGVQGGKLRHRRVPGHARGKGKYVKFCKPGDHIITLGIPIGRDFDPWEFWMGKYAKTKKMLAGWKAIGRRTVVGRCMLANSMVYSRFRYFSSCLVMPKEISKALESDVDALLWDKHPEFIEGELGTIRKGRPMIKKEASYRKYREGGISRLDWTSHEHALRARVVLKYRDPSRADWKLVLDTCWAQRYVEGRGAIFSGYDIRLFTHPHMESEIGERCRIHYHPSFERQQSRLEAWASSPSMSGWQQRRTRRGRSHFSMEGLLSG